MERTINIINAFILIWVLVRRNVSFKIKNHPFSESHLFSWITQRQETTTSAFISTVHYTLTTIKYEKCDSVVGQMKPSIKWSIFIFPLSIVVPNNFMIHDAGVNPQQILNSLYEEEKTFHFNYEFHTSPLLFIFAASVFFLSPPFSVTAFRNGNWC